MLSVVLLSLSAAFAVNDDADVIAIDDNADELAIDEVNIDESLAVDEDDSIVGDGESAVVTEDTFNQYFDENGTLKDSVTAEELTFKGDISDVGVDTIKLNRTIKISGDGVLTNISIDVKANGVVISGITLNQNKGSAAITVYNASNVVVENTKINFNANEGSNGFAINAELADNLKLLNNVINYAGATTGWEVNNVIRVSTSNNIAVSANKVKAKLVSAPVGWTEVPAGSGNWVSSSISEGIVISDSENVTFDVNNVNVTYDNVTGEDDTIYTVDFKNTDNAVISNNNISSTGNSYIYGIILTGDNFNIDGNNVTSVGNYYANGIDIEGTATGVVKNNNIDVKSLVSAYAIYSGMNGQDVVANYTNNNISGNSYNIFGMSVGDVKSNIVKNNITLDGNYTTGIAYRGVEASIKENRVILLSSEVGNEIIWEDFGVESVGIKVIQGNATIFNNTIATSGKGVSFTGNQTNVDVEDNFINVVGNPDKNAFAIYVNEAGVVDILDNTVDYQGNTNGTGINNAVFIYNTDGVVITRNKFDLDLVSSEVPWIEIPAGSGNYVSFPISEGIVVEESDNVLFDDNTVTVEFTDVVGGYDTIYSVDFKNSNNAVILDNEISSKGNTYIYGLIVSGENFTVRLNTINSTGNYYANGIDIEGPASGVVEDNAIAVYSNVSAYAIYSGMNGQDVVANYTNNNISGNSYNIFGMSVGDVKSNIVKNNITLDGNYTTGIAYRGVEASIKENRVILLSSEVGNEIIWEDFGVESVGIKVIQGNATIFNNTIATSGKGVSFTGNQTNVDVEDNFINVVGNPDKNAFAIYVNEAGVVDILDNTVDYQGNTNGTGINNAVFIYNTDGVVITRNKFDLDLVSSEVPWIEIPAGSGNYVSFPISEGIVVEESDNVLFDDNTVTVEFTDVVGGYDTIYSVDFINSNNAVIVNNRISSKGNTYIYGILISGIEFNVNNNIINSSSNYYANGIDIEGPASGSVWNNTIIATVNNLSYPIYGAMSNGDVSVSIYGNEINGSAYLVYGIQLGGKDVAIANNNISAVGNYTVGIGLHVEESTILGNNIVSNASNKGNLSIWDAMGANTEGILITSGDAVIENNNVTATGDNAINTGNNTAIIKDNELKSNNATGADAIKGDNIADSELNTTLVGSDITIVYGEKAQYVLKVSDQNGKAVVGKVVSIVVNNQTLQATTDADGVAKFDLDLNVGKYTIEATFNGTVAYNANSTSNVITVSQKPTVITASDVSVLVTVTKSGYNYKIVLKDNSGNALASQKITVNGKEFTTDNSGIVNYKITASKVGSQKLTIKYAGDNNYAAVTKTATIKITKEATKLTAKKKTFKAKTKTKKYTVTLKDSKGKAIKKLKVTLKIKGKKYTAKTNAKGKATFNIKKLTKKGTYKAKVQFAGNDLYKASSKTVKIKVKK